MAPWSKSAASVRTTRPSRLASNLPSNAQQKPCRGTSTSDIDKASEYSIRSLRIASTGMRIQVHPCFPHS
ncbi:MAG: hypothetical protein ACPIOQ_28130, partial [Promethearchaeia archaeon]